MQIFSNIVKFAWRLQKHCSADSVERHVYLLQQLRNASLITTKSYSYIITAKSNKKKLHNPVNMTDPKIEEELTSYRASVKEQVSIPYGF